jgi:hypothetical protein
MIRSLAMLLALLAVLALAACRAEDPTPSATAAARADSGAIASPAFTEPAVPLPSPSPAAPPAFHAGISSVPTALVAGKTWHAGCPVPVSGLRLVTVTYWGFDQTVREGRLVVNASAAKDIAWVFGRLFRARFPIQDLRLAAPFDPNADPNTKVDITASFNCRPVVTPAGPGTTLSMHSYGLAIDINPLQNPYVAADGHTRNKFARPFLDRSKHLAGMIHPGDVVTSAFAHIGWTWGGTWRSGKDYMHFSSNGR